MRPHPKRARTSARSPRAWATDDRSGFVGNHHNLQWQYQWAGTQLVNLRVLVYPDQLDKPQRQLGTIILPPDPVPIPNARPENYAIDEEPVSCRYTMDGRVRVIAYAPYPQERIVSVGGNITTSVGLVIGTASPAPPPAPAQVVFNFSIATSSMYQPLLGGF